jgi:RHS repeat-associated protein
LLTGTALGVVIDALTYNSFGEAASYEATVNGASLFRTDYAYDKLGRIVNRTETQDSAVSSYTYGYDEAGRLTEVKLNGEPLSIYSYDANGNRLSYHEGSETVEGAYDDQDRLLTYGNTSYTYSPNGELASRTVGTATTTYSYDVLGNLRRVALPNGRVIDYVIDAANRRIGKKVDGALVQGFLYQDQLKPVAELDGSGTVLSRFVYATRSNVPDYLVRDGVIYRIITDHLGSPRFVINTSDGSIPQQMDYDAFGNVTLDTNPGFQPFGFAGGLYDRDTGLVRLGARDYNPHTGRWTAKDPILFAGGDTNLYGYVQNDPVNLIDPLGLSDVGISNYDGREFHWVQSRGLSYDLYGNLYTDGTKVEMTLGIIPVSGPAGLAGAAEGTVCKGAISAGARTEARNLAEQLTLREAQAGAGQKIMEGSIKDPRFPADTWAKMQHVHKTPEGQNIVIHYWQQLKDGFRTGFKFKD